MVKWFKDGILASVLLHSQHGQQVRNILLLLFFPPHRHDKYTYMFLAFCSNAMQWPHHRSLLLLLDLLKNWEQGSWKIIELYQLMVANGHKQNQIGERPFPQFLFWRLFILCPQLNLVIFLDYSLICVYLIVWYLLTAVHLTLSY